MKGGQVSAKWVEGGRWESRAGGARPGSRDAQQARRVPACEGLGGPRPEASFFWLFHLTAHPHLSAAGPALTCLRQGPSGASTSPEVLLGHRAALSWQGPLWTKAPRLGRWNLLGKARLSGPSSPSCPSCTPSLSPTSGYCPSAGQARGGLR